MFALRGAFSRFIAADGFFLGAGLAFFSLVTMIPLVLLSVSTLGFVLSSELAADADRCGLLLAFEPEPGMFIETMQQFEALRARRTYAATDKILVDFSIGGRPMGEEIRVADTPVLKVKIRGAGPLERRGLGVHADHTGVVPSAEPFEDQLGDGAGAAAQVHDHLAARYDDALHDPAVDLGEKRVPRERREGEPVGVRNVRHRAAHCDARRGWMPSGPRWMSRLWFTR